MLDEVHEEGPVGKTGVADYGMQCNESHFVVADLTMSHIFDILLLVPQTGSAAGAAAASVAVSPAAESAVLAMSLPDQCMYWLDWSRTRHGLFSVFSQAVAVDLA